MSMAILNKRMDEWWEERFASGDVDIKREADRGIAEFAADPEFTRLFTEVYMRTVLYNRGIDLSSRRRRLIREEGKAIAQAKPIPTSSSFARPTRFLAPMPPPPRVDDDATDPPTVDSVHLVEASPGAEAFGSAAPVLDAQLTRSWTEWLERDPETGHHVAIDFFTKDKLLAASKRNRERGGRYLYNAALYALFAGRLPDKDTPLGDVLNDNDKNLIAGNLQVKLRTEFGLRGIGRQASWEEMLT